jgi:beta-mannosidase
MRDGGSEKASPPGLRARGDEAEHRLEHGWQVARVPAGAAGSPAELAALGASFATASVPGTVAQRELERQGAPSELPHQGAPFELAHQGTPFELAHQGALDACDYWYGCRFARPAGPYRRALLCCDGLATLAEVWLNGRLVAHSANMWLAQAIDVGGALAADNELWIRFRALGPFLRERRPRGRWPTRLVSERHLRFVRTSLIGYMPGFCPPWPVIGPWRGVRLVLERELSVDRARVLASLEDGRGVLRVRMRCRSASGARERMRAQLIAGETARAALEIERTDDDAWELRGQVTVPSVAPWWPHTHGDPALYPARVVVDLDARAIEVDLGRVGFRSIGRAPDAERFALQVNGESIYCRGACWTPLDVAALHAGAPAYRRALEQVRDAGMNMLRLPGNLAYESDAFYALCDELGILVWQDFMFANMDYPTSDPEFTAGCRAEALQFLERTSGRACLAVLCGNSEVAQQAAMMGQPREHWHDPLFAELLPALCARERPDVPYVPSSPSGGALPFHTGSGPTHYYGVGAYLRPIDDARVRAVGFASECLAFSNVPEPESLRGWLGDQSPAAHDPRFKERVPRDVGAGWDFADVTDHYLEQLFEVSARDLRYADHERYLALCRVTPGEVMARVQGLWRRRTGGCHGAIVWLLRDLWDGPGCGLIDSRGIPKAAYYQLKRAWAPRALWFVDEGTDGLWLHAANDTSTPLAVRIELALHREGGGVVERAARAEALPARGQLSFSVDELIGRFVDSSYAYRFGPPGHTLVVARLVHAVAGAEPEVIARAFHLPLGLALPPQPELGLDAVAHADRSGAYTLELRSERFAQFVSVEAPGYLPDDNHFHLAPGECRRISLCPRAGASVAPLRGRIRALNATAPAVIRVLDAAPAEP